MLGEMLSYINILIVFSGQCVPISLYNKLRNCYEDTQNLVKMMTHQHLRLTRESVISTLHKKQHIQVPG